MTESPARDRPRPLPSVQTSPRLATTGLVYWTDDEPPDLAEIALDSESWFTWLENGQSFRVTYNDAARSVSFNVQPDRRGSRLYWAGYKHIGGRLEKRYLGATAKLSQAKLHDAGAHFLALATEHADRDPTAPLRDALADYESLVTSLVAHLPAHLARYARAEMARIKASLVNE